MNNYKKHKLEKIKYILISFLLLLPVLSLSVSSILPNNIVIAAEPSEEEPTIVRVGYYEQEYFQEGCADDLIKTGYSYEYLQTLATHTGWIYEYVYGDWNTLYEGLLSGDIDILAGVPLSLQNDKIIYPDQVMGTNNYNIYRRVTNSSLASNDPIALDGKKIGILNTQQMKGQINDWLNENQIHCEVLAYNSVEAQKAGIKNKEVDALVGIGSNLGMDSNYTPFAKLGSESYYLAVSATRLDLIDTLNKELEHIYSNNPYFNESLENKYYQHAVVKTNFTENEISWLENHNRLHFGYFRNYIPFCDETEDGKPYGLLKDVTNQITDYLHLSQFLKIEFVAYDSYLEMIDGLHNGEIDVVFPIYNSLWHSEQNGIMQSEEITSVPMSLVYSKTQTEVQSDIIALSKHSPLQQTYVSIYFPDSQIILKDSPQECFEAIRSGEASCTLLTSVRTDYYLGSVTYNDLTTLPLQDMGSICMGVRSGDTALLSLLNRGINSLDSEATTLSMYNYATGYHNYSVADFIVNHIVGVLIASILIVAIIIYAIISYNKANKKYKLAKKEASHDALTGILNRASYNDLIKEYSSSDKNFALLLIDVDVFKSINDTYGHNIGDLVLKRVADLMKVTFRSIDYPCRIGGDEFAIIMIDTTSEMKEIISNKISVMNQILSKVDGDIPAVTLSVGVAFSNIKEGGTIFENADAALYKTKENGRNGCSFYEPTETT